MAKYINLKFEPSVGTAFDYLINVEDVIITIDTNGKMVLSSGHDVPFPLAVGFGDENTAEQLMRKYINDLSLAAIQRAGNEYFIPATDSPVTISAFS